MLPSGEQHQDYLASMVIGAIGVFAIYEGQGYDIGSLTRMGPGFFPVCLGGVLIVIAMLIAIGARWMTAGDAGHARLAPFDARSFVCIGAGTVLFTVLGKYGGLVPATWARKPPVKIVCQNFIQRKRAARPSEPSAR